MYSTDGMNVHGWVLLSIAVFRGGFFYYVVVLFVDALWKLTVCQKHTDGYAYHRSHLFLCQLLYQSQAMEVSMAQCNLLVKSREFTNSMILTSCISMKKSSGYNPIWCTVHCHEYIKPDISFKNPFAILNNSYCSCAVFVKLVIVYSVINRYLQMFTNLGLLR